MHFYFIFHWYVFEFYLINHKFNLFMLQFYFFIISFFVFHDVDVLHCRYLVCRRFTLSTFFFGRHLIFDIFLSTFFCRHFFVDIFLSTFFCRHFVVDVWLLSRRKDASKYQHVRKPWKRIFQMRSRSLGMGTPTLLLRTHIFNSIKKNWFFEY
jgi:hypothetical protein